MEDLVCDYNVILDLSALHKSILTRRDNLRRNSFNLLANILERTLYEKLQRLIGRNWFTDFRLGVFEISTMCVELMLRGQAPTFKH